MEQAARPERAEALSPGQRQQAARPEGAEALSPGLWNKQHALKGQKLLAQGIALGTMTIRKAPCKGKSFVYCPGF